MPLKYKRFSSFAGIDTASESTDSNEQTLRKAENLILRPKGAVTRFPPYSKLWGMSPIQDYASQLNITSTDKTCILEIKCDSGIFLVAHDFLANRSLGVVCAKPTANLSSLTDSTTPPQLRVLARGLKSLQRWYFYQYYESVLMGNGYDENRIYQPSRTDIPLRIMGCNTKPVAPQVLPITQSGAVANKQAELRVQSTNFGSVLVFTANDVSFRGTQGHRISIQIEDSGLNQPITSRRDGAGTIAAPFFYKITLGSQLSQSSFEAIKNFVNNDMLAKGIVSCTLVDAPVKWALSSGIWDDSSAWYDMEIWKD